MEERDSEEEGASSEDELLRPKRRDQSDEAASDDEEGSADELPMLSKRSMRKIKKDGPYEGKNKVMLDASG